MRRPETNDIAYDVKSFVSGRCMLGPPLRGAASSITDVQAACA
jgi:hypothetical protein